MSILLNSSIDMNCRDKPSWDNYYGVGWILHPDNMDLMLVLQQMNRYMPTRSPYTYKVSAYQGRPLISACNRMYVTYASDWASLLCTTLLEVSRVMTWTKVKIRSYKFLMANFISLLRTCEWAYGAKAYRKFLLHLSLGHRSPLLRAPINSYKGYSLKS